MNSRLLLAFLFLPALVLAESPLELAAPGEPLLTMDAHSLSLGGASSARWDLMSGLPDNPAQLAALEGVTFSTVFLMRQASRDTVGGTWEEGRQDFPAFQLTFSLPRGWRIGIGYRSQLRNRGSYVLEEQMTGLPPDEEWDGIYSTEFSQEGGIGTFPLTLAWLPHERLRLGAGLALLRGNRTQDWRYELPAEDGFFDRIVRRQADWHGTLFEAGLQARLGAGAVLALHYRSGANLEGLSAIEIIGVEGSDDSSLRGRYPAFWSAGLAWRLRPWLALSGQWDRQAWSEYESPLGDAELADCDRFGFGMEWTWIQPRRGLRPERRWPLRLGLRLGEFPGKDPVTGERVQESLFSMGTGFSVQGGKGSVDLAIFLQNLDMGPASELRYGLALSLRTSEKWKRRTLSY